MKPGDKELLIKDLCARLPYKPIVHIDDCGIWDLRGVDHDDSAELRDRVIVWHGENYPSSKNSFPIINCKPYLYPLSSMTEEQKEFIKNKFCYDWDIDDHPNSLWAHCIVIGDIDELIDWYHKNHFDFRGLIPKGLANDATRLNIY